MREVLATDALQVPKAHKCAKLLDRVLSDFPTAAAVVFTDDIHFERTRHVLSLAGKAAPLASRRSRSPTR